MCNKNDVDIPEGQMQLCYCITIKENLCSFCNRVIAEHCRCPEQCSDDDRECLQDCSPFRIWHCYAIFCCILILIGVNFFLWAVTL